VLVTCQHMHDPLLLAGTWMSHVSTTKTSIQS
jgi:hypothetical protein